MPRLLTKSVVLVDDETAYLDLLTEQVKINLACPVFSFVSPEEALRSLPELNPGLIITDYQMPGLDGFQFIRGIQKLLPGVPVLMITATSEAFSSDDLLDLTALKAVVRKPFRWAELALHIDRHWPALSQPPFAKDGE